MSWRVLATDNAYEGLSQTEQEAVSSDLFSWVADGPPRRNPRVILGAQLFQEDLPAGFRVSYFVHEAEQYAAIVSVRKI